LKNRLSEYVRDVCSGETVLVTDRGEVVAELIPPGQGHSRQASLDHRIGQAGKRLGFPLQPKNGDPVRI